MVQVCTECGTRKEIQQTECKKCGWYTFEVM